jgi:tetratricopeptide (TPR) repeat protein
MNKKAQKAYDKAMDYYEKGKINKALEICEEILSEGLDNAPVLNFKGLLLYQKGSLSEAVTVWKINQDINNDEIARSYIKDSEVDEKRLDLYKQGERALKQLNIDRALELFKICAESDFNAIKVNTGIGMCYQKKGDFYTAKEYIDKALRIDESAITAKIIEKELKENGIYLESSNSSKGALIVITSLVIIAALAVGGYMVVTKLKNKDTSQVVNGINNVQASEEQKDKTQEENKDTEKEKTQEVQTGNLEGTVKEETQNKKLDTEKLKALVSANDFEGIYEELKNVKAESVSNQDSEVYNKAVKIMKNEGASKFYDYGLWYFNQGNYKDAGISLEKAYTYCEGNAYKEHILFYRASNSLKKRDEKNALKQYEEYYSKYSKGVYTDEALYQLALLTNADDKAKSKKYASTLMNNFPSSIYANDKIATIARS